MEIITSVKNPLIVNTKKIKESPNGKLFLENPKLIEEAYKANKVFDYILIQKDKEDKLLCQFDFLKETKKIYLVSENIINSLSETKSSQGVIAIVNFNSLQLKAPKNNFIVLDNLQDPGNLGTIIRSAKGTTFNDIYLINCVNYLNQKVIRSAMGNIFDLNLYNFSSYKEFAVFTKENNLDLYIADMNGKNIFDINKKVNKIGIVIGNEGQGVSSEIRSLANNTISIPMKNNLESLNAAVSCSIIIYYLDNLN